MSLVNIKFPVLESLRVIGYTLFPGNKENISGIDCQILPGVTVILGINGLGKTTLLNIIQRALLGSYDPKKEDIFRPGTGQHELVFKRDFAYFRERVSDEAKDAYVEARFKFGKDVLTVKRNLSNLQLTGLNYNGQVIDTPDETNDYERYIKRLSGVASRYDFDFVVRNLVFFLEEKTPLIWNPKGQFEILRILFLDNQLAEQCANSQDSFLKADSHYRNRLWQLNNLKKELIDTRSKQHTISNFIEQIPVLKTHYQSISERYDQLSQETASIANEIEEKEKQRYELEVTIRETTLEIERHELTFFSQMFPSIDDVTKRVLGGLLSGEGCLVCGSKCQEIEQRIRQLLERKVCPICETSTRKEVNVIPVAELNQARIKALDEKALKLITELKAVQERTDYLRQQYEQLKDEERKTLNQKTNLYHQLRDAQAQIPRDSYIAQLEDQFYAQQTELLELKITMKSAHDQYKELLMKADEKISQAAEFIVNAFNEYANAFLEEKCTLNYEMHRRKIGESGFELDFPNFIVRMTSGTFSLPSQRLEATSVSESQKEFLDLAFRMAIIKAATKDYPAMLVIETPEASLDSIFVQRAGKMLRQFAIKTQHNIKNTVITSSNLNKENMLSALLGLSPNHYNNNEFIETQIKPYVINLLELAAPSAALEKHRDDYLKSLNEALGIIKR